MFSFAIPDCQLVNQNADLEIEGEIIGYELTPMAVQEDAFASGNSFDNDSENALS